MPSEFAQRLAAAVDSMPAFPISVQKILALTRDVNCSPKELVQVIDKDPVVTMKVLRVVNSAHYGLPQKIASIEHAVVYLGFNTIKNLALGIAAVGMLPAENGAGFDGQHYLVHSLTTASIAKQLAFRFKDADPMDCFIAGLIHDFGKVVLAVFMPKEFRRALETSLWNESSLHLTLTETLGTDHAEVGAMLAEKWRFPQELVDTIRQQYHPEGVNTPMTVYVFAANQISKKLRFGNAGNPVIEQLPAPMAQHLGGSLEDVMAMLGNLESTLQEAQSLARL
jgi:putative nucleotidyltransferase with HDIG domain